MAQATTYKRSFSGSVGSGMKSIMGNGERRYYVLEHKVSTKYHKAGETQKIIVDQIELGRSPNCQVRFDESFTTVSRRHAAIVKDGDNWKLVQLSQTNSTYLNGVKVQKEWYLQSGDEIQLSTNGPKMGFIVPQGSKGLVKSIGMTARLNLFRQQALRPYKQAMTALACVLVLCIAGGGFWISSLNKKLDEQALTLNTRNAELVRQMEEREARERERRRQDSIQHEEDMRRLRSRIAQQEREFERRLSEMNVADLSTLISQQGIVKDVYYLTTVKVTYSINGSAEQEMANVGWAGTGFLLNDGKFVTARHCVQGWLYDDWESGTTLCQATRLAAAGSAKLKAYFLAVNKERDMMELTSDDFTVNQSLDVLAEIGNAEDGSVLLWQFPYPAGADWDEKMWSTDWAYTTNTGGRRGNIKADATLSQRMLPMKNMVILGFPQNLGVMDGDNLVDPIHCEVKTAREGLAANECILHSRGTDHGNSGGPVFALNDQGELTVVGIVSRGDMSSDEYNWAVPICKVYQ